MSKYNVTDLDPERTFERHVFHRDQFAHYLRWTHILKITQNKRNIVLTDFGCGKGHLAEVLYRNRHSLQLYQGVDIRKKTIDKAKEKFENVSWVKFHAADLVLDDLSYLEPADIVVSFEVIEHVGKQNADVFLQKFRDCGKENATYYLSTPNYDEKVGAAQNHIYNGQVQEFEHEELQSYLEKYFVIEKKFGTFASQKDYKPLFNKAERALYDKLNEYYDANLVSNIYAPLYPEQARNCMWVLKRI